MRGLFAALVLVAVAAPGVANSTPKKSIGWKTRTIIRLAGRCVQSGRDPDQCFCFVDKLREVIPDESAKVGESMIEDAAKACGLSTDEPKSEEPASKDPGPGVL